MCDCKEGITAASKYLVNVCCQTDGFAGYRHNGFQTQKMLQFVCQLNY